MKARIDAILADPKSAGNVFELMVKAAFEVAARHMIEKILADFIKTNGAEFGGGGFIDRRKREKIGEKIPELLVPRKRSM